jgi:tRNA threonylcarbamoyladenosine biosynthesis protein TsaE
MNCNHTDCGAGTISHKRVIRTAVTELIFPSMILWKICRNQTVCMSSERHNSLSLDCRDEAMTDWLGSRIAESVASGLVIELNGQLGAGKTRLVRAICAGLQIDTAQVSSPTFVLLQLYTDGRIPVAHFDTYRLGDTDEFLAIGADEFMNNGEWLCLVEWAGRVAECLPADRLRIDISAISAAARLVQFTSTGIISASLLQRIRENIQKSDG